MSALAALPPIERETMLPDRPRAADKGFAKEMDSAQKADDHKPVKKQEPPKKRASDDDRDDSPPPPEAQAQKDQPQVQTAPAAAAKAEGVNPLIGQTVADAAQQVASAMQQGTAVAGNPLGDPSVQSILTPLEQAVHDLIDQARTASHDEPAKADMPAPVVAPDVKAAADDPKPVLEAEPPAPIAEQPEPPVMTNPSHVHLVLDEAERLVVTVAVRGDSVIAHVRGGDEQTAASLARNAGSLDNAMRARGLNLADFQAHRDDTNSPERQQQSRERTAKQPKFTLEDMQ